MNNSCVANKLSILRAKYYRNWLTFVESAVKIIRVAFLGPHCIQLHLGLTIRLTNLTQDRHTIPHHPGGRGLDLP